MKELSIEQKAQAYDGVREKIAIRFGSNVADEIFSEFEMSEDEKIRQFLIHEVTETSDKIMSYRNMNKEAVLAWLEKQYDKDEEILILKDQIESLHAAIKAIKETHRIELEKIKSQGKSNMGISEATKQKLEDNLNKALEKETPESFNKFLDEQKPADKVEPSIFKDRLLELFQIFRWRCKDHILTNGEILEYVDAHIQELIGTMQKPADTEKGAKGNDREIPISVWSEEDERMLNEVILGLKVLKYKDSGEEEKAACQREINWLESLKERYTWKPSDEQMEALKKAIDGVIGDVLNWHSKDRSLLDSLYTDLKKLRGA